MTGKVLDQTQNDSPFRGRRVLVLDDASAIVGSAQYLITEKIGPKRAFTPDGYLLCQDVPIARTGEQLYAKGETPLVVGDQGYLIIERSEAEVFKPEFLASFEGKPVTNGHPKTKDGVHAGNWKEHAVGTVINPRRGEGNLKDYIVADLLVTDAAAIRAVMEGKREVSAGYAAEYEQISKGRGRQHSMLGNHVALVDAARCGATCSIGDAAAQNATEIDMHTQDNAAAPALDAAHPAMRLWNRFATAIRAAFPKDQVEALNAALSTVTPTAAMVTDCGMVAMDEEARGRVTKLETDMAAIRMAFDAYVAKNPAPTKDAATAATDEAARMVADQLADEAPTGVADKARLATDSEFLRDSFQEAVAGAEILVPGITLPKYVKDAKPSETLLDITKLRRSSLELLASMPNGRATIESLNGGKKLAFDSMTPGEARTIFRAAVTARKATQASDAAARDAAARAAQATAQAQGKQPIRSIAALNAANKAHYEKQGAKAS